jgi:hypothetical protein
MHCRSNPIFDSSILVSTAKSCSIVCLHRRFHLNLSLIRLLFLCRSVFSVAWDIFCTKHQNSVCKQMLVSRYLNKWLLTYSNAMLLFHTIRTTLHKCLSDLISLHRHTRSIVYNSISWNLLCKQSNTILLHSV